MKQFFMFNDKMVEISDSQQDLERQVAIQEFQTIIARCNIGFPIFMSYELRWRGMKTNVTTYGFFDRNQFTVKNEIDVRPEMILKIQINDHEFFSTPFYANERWMYDDQKLIRQILGVIDPYDWRQVKTNFSWLPRNRKDLPPYTYRYVANVVC